MRTASTRSWQWPGLRHEPGSPRCSGAGPARRPGHQMEAAVMTDGRMIELAAAVVILGAGIVLYRRKPTDGSTYGNQGAVILLVVALIMTIHALGGLDYHPSKA